MTERSRKIISGAIRTIIKLAIAAAVIAWLCRSFDFNAVAAFSSFDYRIMIPVILIAFFTNIIAGIRWKSLAETISIPLTVFKAFSLTMQGLFFSLVIPGGSIGGDVVKMAAITGHVKKGTRTEGIFSIIMDRIVGMIALFALALILLFSRRNIFSDLSFDHAASAPAGILLWWLFTGVCAAGLLIAFLVFIHRKIENLPVFRSLFSFIDKKSSGKFSRFSSAADAYASDGRKITFWVILTILLIHLTPAVSMFLLLKGTGITPAIPAVITAVIIGNIAGLIPLFPGGIGIRDSITISLLAASGIPAQNAATAQLLATILLIFVNLTGSFFFIFDRKTAGGAL